MHCSRCGIRIEYKNRQMSSCECPYGPRGPPCPYGPRDRPILKTHLIYKDRHLSSCECPYGPRDRPILKTHLIYKDRHLSSCECPYEPYEPYIPSYT